MEETLKGTRKGNKTWFMSGDHRTRTSIPTPRSRYLTPLQPPNPPSDLRVQILTPVRRILKGPDRAPSNRAAVVVVVNLPRVGVARQVVEQAAHFVVHLAVVVVLAQPAAVRGLVERLRRFDAALDEVLFVVEGESFLQV